MEEVEKGTGRYRKQRPDAPEGWIWKESGPRGAAWYPPITEGAVDSAGEHLALVMVDEDREPQGDPLALVGPAEGDDEVLVRFISRSDEAMEGVSRLLDNAFQETGVPPTFDDVYDYAGSTANRSYANPMWRYVEGG